MMDATAETTPLGLRPSQSLFAVTYRAGTAWKVDMPMAAQDLRAHFFYLKDLHERGEVLVAGPLGERGGLVILRVAGADAARRIAAADPAVQSRVFEADVETFVPSIGTVAS